MSQEASSNSTYGFPAIYLGTNQALSVAATPTQSGIMADITTIVRVFSTVDCFIKIGVGVVATSSDTFIPGGILQHFGVLKSPGTLLSVIAKNTVGSMYVTEGA